MKEKFSILDIDHDGVITGSDAYLTALAISALIGVACFKFAFWHERRRK